MSLFYITIQGLEYLKQEVQNLKTYDRHEVIKAIATAREYGDLSENAEYHAAREKQSFIEGKIIELEDKISRAEAIDITKLNGNSIKFGATVKLADNDTDKELSYILVGEHEAAKLVAKNNITLISISSPIARALIGKKVGDIAEVFTPKAVKLYEVLEVHFIDIEFIESKPSA